MKRNWAIESRACGPIQSPNRQITKSPNSPAFTLVELLVSMAVLALMMVLISQLFNSAMVVTGPGNKHMDADAQTRAVFDRMAIDFSQMVKRTDVDYYLKDPNTNQNGNDQLAFYSQVPGYFITGTSPQNQSPVSLVAYRVNSDNSSPYYNKLQRYGCGLVWSVPSGTPVVFSSSSTTSLPNTISQNWPHATDPAAADSNYELSGPQVFRMEYYYVLRGQTVAGSSYPAILSDIPWDVRIPNHTSVNGLRDVAAIGVALAVIDPKSRILVNDAQLAQLAGKLNDFPHTDTSTGNNTTNPGDLEAQWQGAINNANANGITIPHVVLANLRVYSRTFYLPSNTP